MTDPDLDNAPDILTVPPELASSDAAGNMLIGYEAITIDYAQGAGPKIANETLNPPSNASYGVPFLQGFSFKYVGEDHHVRAIGLAVKPLGIGPPARLTVEAELSDDLKSSWEGSVTVTVLYFAPYWSS